MALLLILAVFPGFHSPVSAQQSERQILVGFAQDTLANDWRLAQVKQIEQQLAAYPSIRFIYSDGRGSTAKQVSDIEDMIALGVDILITSPRDERAMTPVIAEAYRKGIPVILVTRKIESDAYTTFISPDDAAIAREAAIFMAEELQHSGNILMLQGLPSTTTAIQRSNAFIQALSGYPEVQVVATRVGNYLRSDAIKAVEEALLKGLEFDAIFAQSDSMASGARIALRSAGIDPAEIVIVGIDYIDEARRAIISGEQRASFTYPLCADETVAAVLDITAGKAVAKQISVPSRLVTHQNAADTAPIF